MEDIKAALNSKKIQKKSNDTLGLGESLKATKGRSKKKVFKNKQQI